MTARHGNSENTPHICIITGSHLWRNPRAVKEADALVEAGFKVTVVGPLISEQDQARDKILLQNRKWQRVASPNLLAPSLFGYRRFLARVKKRLSILVVRHFGLSLAGSLAYSIGDTIRSAKKLQADIYSCHQEAGLVAFESLSKKGFVCTVDIEDWYSKDLLPEAQKDRPIALLRRLEKLALQNAKVTFTTSQALAVALAAENDSKLPVVLFNAFEWAGRTRMDGQTRDRKNPEIPSLQWFSQTIGPGRGLEELIDAVQLIDRAFELHIRGDGSDVYKQALLSRLPAEKRANIFFHATTDPDALLSRLAEHDIGLALEQSVPASRDLTITNKVFQYLQAGCAVLASKTSGQQDAQTCFPGAISLTDLDPKAIAGALLELLADPVRLEMAKASALEAARTSASWEIAARQLVTIYRDALNPASAK
ncbi:MAG: glycosyltransferase [Arenimonas sp.]